MNGRRHQGLRCAFPLPLPLGRLTRPPGTNASLAPCPLPLADGPLRGHQSLGALPHRLPCDGGSRYHDVQNILNCPDERSFRNCMAAYRATAA